MPRELEPGRRYRVTFGEARCVGVGMEFTAGFVRWRADPSMPHARSFDRALWDNGVELGPRSASWRAEPMESCEHTPETWC